MNHGSRETVAQTSMRMDISKVNFYYGEKQTLFDISMGIAQNRVTALIGPSGCGKSTLLRTFNRMHETVRNARLDGEILLDGQNILAQDVTQLRRRIGMVFQKPTPFPMSIYDNIAFGVRLYESLPRHELDERIESALRRAALWEEVKDKKWEANRMATYAAMVARMDTPRAKRGGSNYQGLWSSRWQKRLT